MQTKDISIEALGAQGDGLARLPDGQLLFIAGALQGELVRIAADGAGRAQLLEVLKPSPSRQTPPCPHAGQCGGCRFQHMAPEAYRAFKSESLKQTLLRAGLDDLPLMPPPLISPPASCRRARLTANHTRHGIKLGFNAYHAHEVIDLATCSVLVPELTNLLPALRKQLALWLPAGQKCDVHLTSLAGGIDMLLIGGPKLNLDSRQKLATLAEALNLARISWRKDDASASEPVAARARLTLAFGASEVPFPPAAFLQATQAGETALTTFAKTYCKKNARVVDLFCGLGTFGLSLPSPKILHFVDSDGPAIEALNQALKGRAKATVARRNLMNDPLGATELSADYDLVIFDPPRAGARRQAQQIARASVPDVLAISCDPVSFARDAKTLQEGGYRLTALQPVDQFLWSPHIELAAHFTKGE